MVEKKGFKWVNERPDAKSENDEKWGWIGEKPGACAIGSLPCRWLLLAAASAALRVPAPPRICSCWHSDSHVQRVGGMPFLAGLRRLMRQLLAALPLAALPLQAIMWCLAWTRAAAATPRARGAA